MHDEPLKVDNPVEKIRMKAEITTKENQYMNKQTKRQNDAND
jgi:hypothetical protein